MISRAAATYTRVGMDRESTEERVSGLIPAPIWDKSDSVDRPVVWNGCHRAR